MSDSVILEEEIDENYEPTEEGRIYTEIEEYAQWLGMKLPEDNDYLYIAQEGIKAPLPLCWKPCKTKEGDIYYFNFETSESVWEHPCDKFFREKFEEAKSKKSSGKVLAEVSMEQLDGYQSLDVITENSFEKEMSPDFGSDMSMVSNFERDLEEEVSVNLETRS